MGRLLPKAAGNAPVLNLEGVGLVLELRPGAGKSPGAGNLMGTRPILQVKSGVAGEQPMALAKRDEGSKVTSDINVTPMVDVMLVLLIIFMVITPMLQKGVSVDLAKVN